MTNWMASHGLKAADAGFHVFPAMAGEKEPGKWFGGAWEPMHDWPRFCERPPTPLELDHWAKWPAASVSVACGAAVGLDVDIEDRALALQVREVLERALGSTPLVRYGRRPRMMLVYRATTPFRSEGLNAGPVATYATGRQFIAWGIHPVTGAPYEWEDATPADTSLTSLPAVSQEQVRRALNEVMAVLPLTMRATRPREPGDGLPHDDEPSTPEAVRSAVDALPIGPWTEYQYWLEIGMAIHQALEASAEGLAIFDDWSSRDSGVSADGKPRYRPEELPKKWASFGRYGGRRVTVGTLFQEARLNGWTPPPGVHLTRREAEWASAPHPAAALIAQLSATPKPKPATPEPAPEPRPEPRRAAFDWRAGLEGGLKTYMDACLASAVREQPWMTLGGALCTFSAAMGRRYIGPSGLRPNIYAIALGLSTSGKGHVLSFAQRALRQAELGRIIGGSAIASGQAMVAAMECQPQLLYAIDEVHVLLAGAVAKGGGTNAHQAAIGQNLLTFFSASGEVWMGTDYANRKDRPRTAIVQPSLTLLGASTPQAFWSILKSGQASDGTMGRLLVFDAGNSIPFQKLDGTTAVVPGALIDVLRRIDQGVPGHTHFPMGDTSASEPNPYQVGYENAGARDLMRSMTRDVDVRLQTVGGTPEGNLLGRAMEQTHKLALIRAVASNPDGPKLRVGDLEWARGVVAILNEQALEAIQEHMADNEQEAMAKRVLRVVRDGARREPYWLSLSDITRATQMIDRRRRQDILDDLLAGGLIVREARSTGGRPGAFYSTPDNASGHGQDEAVRAA